MSGIELRWLGGSQYVATDPAGHTVVTDAEGKGFKPPDLLLVSLAACAGVDVAQILEKKRQPFTGIEVNVRKEHALEAPWEIEKIEMEWVVRGRNLKEKAVRDAVRLSVHKYCSVSASLKSELVTSVRLVNDDE